MIDEKLIMEKIAANNSLKSILKVIALTVEKQINNSFCSILLVNADGTRLRHGAAPNLPKDYNLAMDGTAVGEGLGSCGTAAHTKEPVFVSDIATNPLWKDYKKLALNHTLKACWSLPIISKKEDSVLGTVAIYYPTIKIPDPWDIELLKRVSNYIRIAIEKNKSNNVLINSETKYRNLFERNLAGTYQTTIDGKILRANNTFANIVGYETSEKLLEENANTFYFSKEERKVFLKDLKKNKKLINREKIVKHKNGSIVYLLENCYLQRDPLLGADIIEGVMIDITERKNAEKSLEESFSNIEAILESTADGILVVDAVGNIMRFNKKFLKLWKIPEHIMDSMNENKALDFVLDQLKSPQKMRTKVKELYASPGAISSDIIELKDGRVVERYSQPNITNGVHRGRVWSFRNITERINAEKEKQQLFALVETSQDIIAFGDTHGNPTYMNKAAKKHLGIDENKKPFNLKFHDFFDSEEIKFIKEDISEGIKKQGRWKGETHIVNIKTKKKIKVHMSAFVIRDNATGKAIGLGNVSRDITAIEKINKKLVKAKKRAEKLANFKDQFLANMSHEIRTPLGIIIGFTKILLRNAVDENQKDQLTAIKTSGDTLLVVINDILDLSKIEAGKMTLEKTELKVLNLIDTILSTFKLQLEEKNQTLKTYYDQRIPKWLLGDPVRINQILFNLIGNAIKFTPPKGSIGVKVNLLKQDTERIFIEILVSDSGIGIPKDKIDEIFNLYSQSNKYTTRKFGGSGLGLNIVKQLIDLMKGTVLVKSSLGAGSTFTVTIPLLKTSIKENKIKKIVSNEKKLKPLKNIKILIVDDMLINQFLAKTIIQQLGFKSDIADNGENAIALLEKNEYDIILMDLQMPKMDGWETCIHVRNKMEGQKSRTPIIAVSADVSKKDINRCEEVGMDDYVSKPINETELLDKITRLVPRKNDKIIDSQQEATKICNLEYLKNHLNHKPEYIKEMLQMILKEIPVIIGQANKSIDAGDWNGLHRKIHSIESTLILMGLPKEIIVTSKQIEENAEKEEQLDIVPAQFIKLEKALEKGYTELEAELKTIKS
jgi:PAS domain S-box-containing protein